MKASVFIAIFIVIVSVISMGMSVVGSTEYHVHFGAVLYFTGVALICYSIKESK
jgi:hypothetical protein